MSRVLITGSADGLGAIGARQLIEGGHEVVLHARSESRSADALAGAPGAAGALSGDLSSLDGMRAVAAQANDSGAFDAVIHNAAVGFQEPEKVLTDDGLGHVFAVNVLAPYVLTALIQRPARLIYLGSQMHRNGDRGIDDMLWEQRPWRGARAYSESKLLDIALSFAVAARWADVCANAVDPGWVPTRMGGPGAPDDPQDGARTQGWLAVSDDPAARSSGGYWRDRTTIEAHPAASDPAVQERLLAVCARVSGVTLPAGEQARPPSRRPARTT